MGRACSGFSTWHAGLSKAQWEREQAVSFVKASEHTAKNIPSLGLQQSGKEECGWMDGWMDG